MNLIMNIRTLFLFLIVITFLTGCKDGPTAEELAQSAFLKLLNGTWELKTAEVDDLVVTNAFPGLEVTFLPKNKITVTGAVGNIWPEASTFELVKTANGYNLNRDDGVQLEIGSLDNTELVVSMNFASAPGSRVSSVPGSYTFFLGK